MHLLHIDKFKNVFQSCNRIIYKPLTWGLLQHFAVRVENVSGPFRELSVVSEE